MKKRVRAIIVKDRAVLLIHRVKEGEEYWVFPGGGMEESDNHDEISALQRECKEELGVEVRVGDLFETLTNANTEEKFYFCTITSGVLGTGTGPEFKKNPGYKGSYTLEWHALSRLTDKKVLPESVKRKLQQEVL